MQPELSQKVRTFIVGHLRSVEDLQLLIALVQSPDRWWDAAVAARELNVTRTVAARTLDHLARHNLLDIRITGDVRYQFHPGTEELRDAAVACVDEYRRNPLAVLKAVTGQPQRSIRDFADAFRIRRDDDR